MVTATNEFDDNSKLVSFPDIKKAIERISCGDRATTQFLNVQSLLQFWLWGSDANETCDRGKCDFHLMQLTGMVCTRVLTEAYQDVSDPIDFVPSVIDNEDVRLLTDSCTLFLPHFYDVDSNKSPQSKPEEQHNMQPGRIQSNPVQSPPVKDANVKDATVKDPSTEHSMPVSIDVPGLVSLQHLRDLVHAIQTQWPAIQKAVETMGSRKRQLELLQVVDRLVTQLFVWFGHYLFNDNIQDWQADDKEFVDNIPPTHALSLTEMGIKFYLNIFFILFRLLFLQRHAVAVPCGMDNETGSNQTGSNQTESNSFQIETFHLEAGVDDFHLLGMYFDIPAGCLLEYKHSYSGFYNNVSQVVYRHFPSYQRRLPVSLSDVSSTDAKDLFVLPALKQIYPEIEFAFEDHHFYREIAGVRVAVLLSHFQVARNSVRTELQTVDTTRCKKVQSSSINHRISEKLQARLSFCKDGGNASSESKSVAAEEGRNARITDWFWFTIGANVYLICTRDGIAYSGSCRDLLAFYLSILNKKSKRTGGNI